MEKNRRAQLKECFEQLKKQLPHSESEKKASNLSILGSACRTVQSLKRKERELEHEMERLAREKVAQQKRIMVLRRELAAHTDQDPSYFLSDAEVATLGVAAAGSGGGGGAIRERCTCFRLSCALTKDRRLMWVISCFLFCL